MVLVNISVSRLRNTDETLDFSLTATASKAPHRKTAVQEERCRQQSFAKEVRGEKAAEFTFKW